MKIINEIASIPLRGTLAMTIVSVIFLSYTSAAHALTISNDNYILQMQPKDPYSYPTPLPQQQKFYHDFQPCLLFYQWLQQRY